MNYAYVTLLSSMDYIPPILILDRNLKELKSKYPLYVMVTEDIYEQAINYLKQEDVLYVKVPVIQYSAITIAQTQNTRMLSIASKLNVFRLHQFDKVLYLDADCILLKNIDEVFNYPDGAMYDDKQEQGFVGFFVCSPRAHALNYYLIILEHSPTITWESDVLEPLWFPFKTNPDYRIPFSYFVNVTNEDLDIIKQQMPIYGVHFCYKYKPWNYISTEDYFNDYTSELVNTGWVRREIIDFYINKYTLPIRNKYPELF